MDWSCNSPSLLFAGICKAVCKDSCSSSAALLPIASGAWVSCGVLEWQGHRGDRSFQLRSLVRMRDVCRYLFIYRYIHTYMHTYTHTYMYTYIHTCSDVIINTHTHISIRICICIRTCIDVYRYRYIYIYKHLCA